MNVVIKGRPAVVLYFEVMLPGVAKKVTVQMPITRSEHVQREILVPCEAVVSVDQVVKLELALLADPYSEVTAITFLGKSADQDRRYEPLPLPK